MLNLCSSYTYTNLNLKCDLKRATNCVLRITRVWPLFCSIQIYKVCNFYLFFYLHRLSNICTTFGTMRFCCHFIETMYKDRYRVIKIWLQLSIKRKNVPPRIFLGSKIAFIKKNQEHPQNKKSLKKGKETLSTSKINLYKNFYLPVITWNKKYSSKKVVSKFDIQAWENFFFCTYSF